MVAGDLVKWFDCGACEMTRQIDKFELE